MKLQDILSITSKNQKRSAIRELLKLTQKPEVISFAGGLPSPESFPVQQLKEITNKVMEEEAAVVLQYGTTEGDPLLREQLAKYHEQFGIHVSPDQILITTASQQGLDLFAKILIDRGDKVIAGLPSYLGGLSAFYSYGADVIGIPMDEHGIRSDKMDETIADLIAKGQKPKFIYLIPEFQNPDGVTIPDARRREILEIARKYDLLILEDSPYRELRYEGTHQTPLYSMDTDGRVVMLGTFSKIFVPGFRIGWVIANPEVIDRLIAAKQAADLCTPMFTQRIAARYMETGCLESNIKRVVEMYREKRKIMLDALQTYMPEECSWTKPDGGLFLFLYLPEYLDADEVLQEAIKNNVAYVSGGNFFADGTGKNTARINFSFASNERNVEGVKRLACVIREAMAKAKVKQEA